MIKRVIALVALLFAYLGANENIVAYKIENKNHAISAQTIAAGLEDNGYVVSKNQDMNDPYLKQFGNSTFDSYNLMSVYHPEFAKNSVAKSIRAGIFVPFSVGVYQRKNDSNLYVALLSAKAQQRILNIEDKLFTQLEDLNKKTIKKILPNATISTLDYKSTQTDKKFYTEYSFDIDDADAEDEYNNMMMSMDGNMKMGGFVVANYIDYNQELQDNDVNDYIFFHSFSLCKLKVIYELSKNTPEAGAFAPCTMIIYHKKGSNQTKIISLNINGLISILALRDKTLVDMLDKTQSEMIGIIKDSTE